MKKAILALTLAGVLALSPAVSLACQAAEIKTAEAETYREWKTDIRLSAVKESGLMKEAGLTREQMDKITDQARKTGLDHPFTEEELLEKDPSTDIRRENGTIYYIGKSKAFRPVKDFQDACLLAGRLHRLLGGPEHADVRLWSRLKRNDMTVYCFQQISDSETVIGSSLKIAVDQNNMVSAVFNALDPEADGEETIVTKQEAEEAVLAKLQKEGEEKEILSEFTDRCPHTLGTLEMLDVENEDDVPEQLRWIVYTEEKDDQEHPFLAHYVKLDGTYLYSLPVKQPGDEEAVNGYRKQDVFAGMTQSEWTGEAEDLNGSKKKLTLPVLYDETAGKTYLGDLDRRIAVADFASAAYGEDHQLDLVSSDEWDNEDLLMYDNYIKAWDFYADMGWMGPDGQGTDVIILKDLCTRSGNVFENACSIGMVENWQMFGYAGYAQTVGDEDRSPLGLVQALDVMAHEYTHTFTSAMLGSQVYENDQGAINEAMSDIMGNLVEQICGATDDTGWSVGENTGMIIRSMSCPEAYNQPAYTWDLFYGPHTDSPTIMNDRGGVHYNSSLLNRIAALLCLDGGMEQAEAVGFWTMAECGMTPGTDYCQMEALLEWALEESGNGAYASKLAELITEEELERTEEPEYLPAGRKLVRLRLPETEAFEDENWVLLSLQPNTDVITGFGKSIIELFTSLFKEEDTMQSMTRVINTLADHLHMDRNRLKLDRLDEADSEEAEDILTNLVVTALGKLIVQRIGWESAGTGEVTMLTTEVPSLYVLMNMGEAGTKINALAILIGDRWYDLTPIKKLAENGITDQKSIEKVLKNTALDLAAGFGRNRADKNEGTKVDSKVTLLLDAVLEGAKILDSLLSEDGKLPAKVEYLPVEGLSRVELMTD